PLAQPAPAAVVVITEHRRPRNRPATGALDQLGPEFDLRLELDLASGIFALRRRSGSSHHSPGRYSAHPSGTVPVLPTACTDTPSWQLPIFPSVPEYWRLTPGESLPSFGNPVSSNTHASTSISGATRSATAL